MILGTHVLAKLGMTQAELKEIKEEEEHDRWFNRVRPMTKEKKTSREK
jgi:hypothetical protein